MSKTYGKAVLCCGFFLLGGCGAAPEMGGDPTLNEVTDALTSLRSFSCVQTSSGRAAYKQSVTGQFDAESVPHGVKVFRGPNATLEHSADVGVLVPGYSGGYFEKTYGLAAYSLGSEGTNDYYLLEPMSGVTGSFTGQLHLQFNHGTYGWWQKIMACTVQ